MNSGWRRSRRSWISTGGLVLGMIFWGLTFASTAGAFLPSKRDPGTQGPGISGYQYLMGKEEIKERSRRYLAPKVSKETTDRNLKEFVQRYGDGWHITLNKLTGVPHQAVAPTDDNFTGLWRRLFASRQDPVDYASQFVQENAQLFRLGNSETRLSRTTERGGISYVDFQQEYQGIPVYGSRIWFRFDDSSQLMSFGADTYPDLALDVTPLIDEAKAWDMVKQHLGISSTGSSLSQAPDTDKSAASLSGNGYKAELVILPAHLGNDLQYFLAWMVDVEGGIWRYFVDARDGQFISRLNRSRQLISGQIRGWVLPQFAKDKPVLVPLRNQHIYLLNKSAPVYEALFHDGNSPAESNPGWSADGLWEYGKPTPQTIFAQEHCGPPDPASGHTGNYIYGYNLSGDYTNLMRPMYLTTQPIGYRINKGSRLTLRFWRWLGIYKEYSEDEEVPTANFDRASIDVSSDKSMTWTTAWSNGTSQIEDAIYKDGQWSGWTLQFVDISPYVSDSNSVSIRWGMGPTDASGIFCGWNIDDVQILESQEVVTDPNGNFQFPVAWPTNTLVANLTGKYVEVSDEDRSDALYIDENIPDTDAVYNYDWNPADPAVSKNRTPSYDEVNVYYHINNMLQYIKQIEPGYEGMDRDGKKGAIKIITRWGDFYDDAFWTPDNQIRFGEGDSKLNGYRDFALFSDIIYHEYTHAITESFYSFFMPPPDPGLNATTTSTTSTNTNSTSTTQQRILTTELDAMHEGFSDYWTGAVTGDSKIGNGDIWVGHDYVRSLENTSKYPENWTDDDAYANSQIISGAMWDVRKKLKETGNEKDADILFHFARYAGTTSFSDYLQAIVEQDRVRFKSKYSASIKDLFGKRGISKSPLAPTDPVGTVTDKSITLTWVAPNDPDITGYHVYYRTENDIASNQQDPSVQKDAKNVTSYTIDGLTNETTYVIKVASYNKYGTESVPSDYVYATPYDPATKFGITSGSSGDNGSVGLCFINSIR